MTSHQKYHPYRFSSLAKESARRLQEIVAGQVGKNSQELLACAYPTLSTNEIVRRSKDKSALADAHNVWAKGGRRVIDVSQLMAQLQEATAIEFKTMPEGPLPETFHVHFGSEAALSLSAEPRQFISGVTVTPHADGDEGNLRFAFVTNSDAPSPPAMMSLTELLKEESAVAFVAAPRRDLFEIFSASPSGDPRLCSDPVLRAATLRTLVAIRHALVPQLEDAPRNNATAGRFR